MRKMLKKKENQNHMPKLKRAEAEWIRDALLSRFESQIRARLDDIKVYGDKYDFGIIVGLIKGYQIIDHVLNLIVKWSE